jgi:hypothetical protein
VEEQLAKPVPQRINTNILFRQGLNEVTTTFSRLPAHARPNTCSPFQLLSPWAIPLSPSPPILTHSLGKFSWGYTLVRYLWLAGILKYGCLLGYDGPPQFILSKNLKPSELAPSIITEKLSSGLAIGRVILAASPPFPPSVHLLPIRFSTKRRKRFPSYSSSISPQWPLSQRPYTEAL